FGIEFTRDDVVVAGVRWLDWQRETVVVQYFDRATGAVRRTLQMPDWATAPCFALSPDGRRLGYPHDRAFYVHETATGRARFHVAMTDAEVAHPAAFAPDGKSFAIADTTLRVHDAPNGKVLHDLKFPGQAFPGQVSSAVVYSPDARFLAVL